MATFITSKGVGETIQINTLTSTGYWKYNHNGTDSSVFSNGKQTITVANANGEFTLISCLADGTVSGDLTYFDLGNNQLTSFDGTDLTGLTTLYLYNNQLTSFDGTDLSALTYLSLDNNQLTSFDGTGLSALTSLNLGNNQLTAFDGTDLTALTYLNLSNNQLTSFDGTGLSALTQLNLGNNQLTSLDVLPMTSLLNLFLTDPYGLNGNPMTATANNTILAGLVTNGNSNGYFYTSGGRTAAGTADYDALIAGGWTLLGLDLVVVGTGKLRVKGVGQLKP